MVATLIMVAIVAIPIGVLSAIKQYSAFDILATTLSFMGQAIPEFWLGLIFSSWFSMSPWIIRLQVSPSFHQGACIPSGPISRSGTNSIT